MRWGKNGGFTTATPETRDSVSSDLIIWWRQELLEKLKAQGISRSKLQEVYISIAMAELYTADPTMPITIDDRVDGYVELSSELLDEPVKLDPKDFFDVMQTVILNDRDDSYLRTDPRKRYIDGCLIDSDGKLGPKPSIGVSEIAEALGGAAPSASEDIVADEMIIELAGELDSYAAEHMAEEAETAAAKKTAAEAKAKAKLESEAKAKADATARKAKTETMAKAKTIAEEAVSYKRGDHSIYTRKGGGAPFRIRIGESDSEGGDAAKDDSEDKAPDTTRPR